MNLLHGWLCSSERWAGVVRDYIIPYALENVALGADTLEIGPGYGATTSTLVQRTTSLTALELDTKLTRRLKGTVDPRVRVVEGDGTAMPFADASFDSVVCFTMLHHVPSVALQDRLFAQALRVLRPGGTFAGSDSVTSTGFRLLHVRDTMVCVDPETLPARLRDVGFENVAVDVLPKKGFRFAARRPA